MAVAVIEPVEPFVEIQSFVVTKQSKTSQENSAISDWCEK